MEPRAPDDEIERRVGGTQARTSELDKDGATLTVLVCDDADAVRSRLVSMIKRIPGVTIVGEAGNAETCVDLIESHHPEVAVLDIKLPDASGIQVLRRIKMDFPDVTVVMLTNHANAMYRRVCMNSGAHYFFDKSTEFENVGRVLRLLSKRDADDQAMQ